MRWLTLLAVAACVTGSQRGVDKPFQSKLWLEDFDQLKQAIVDIYPNFDWAVERHRLDVRALDRRVRSELRAATSPLEATAVLKRFVARFGDPHFKLDLTTSSTVPPPPEDRGPLSTTMSGRQACAKMGMSQEPATPAFPIGGGVHEIVDPDGTFFLGMIQTTRGPVGVLRIHSFREEAYLELCVDEWERNRPAAKSDCNDDCQAEFKHRLKNRLLAEVEIAVRLLQQRNIHALLVDLTRNGGGSGWVEGVRTILTSKPLMCGQTAFIRHPHYVDHFTRERAELVLELASARSAEERLMIETEIELTDRRLVAARMKCDRSKRWTEPELPPSCDLVVRSEPALCKPSGRYPAVTNLYSGPVFILADQRTASASEDLVGRFKDNKIAVILGARTAGAGCGYTDGGIPIRLRNSGISVKMPDCARFMLDGANEVGGIEPDVALPMDQIGSERFVVELIRAIEAATGQNQGLSSSAAAGGRSRH